MVNKSSFNVTTGLKAKCMFFKNIDNLVELGTVYGCAALVNEVNDSMKHIYYLQ